MSYAFCFSTFAAICLGVLLGLTFAAICQLILWCAMWCAIAVAMSLAIDAVMGLGPVACRVRVTVRNWMRRRRRSHLSVVVPFSP